MKVMIIGGISRSLVNFRGPLMCAMRSNGHEVLACAGEPNKDATDILRNWGIKFVPIHLFRVGMRPWEDLKTCWELFFLIRKFKPDKILTYTIKPVIWGSLAARLAGVKDIHALITGLGYAFVSRKGLKGRIIKIMTTSLYWMSLQKCCRVFFQNPDDMKEFEDRRLVKKKQCLLVNGSGVDLDYYGLASLMQTLY